MKRISLIAIVAVLLLLCSCASPDTKETESTSSAPYNYSSSDYEKDEDDYDPDMEGVSIAEPPVKEYTDGYGLVYELVKGTYDEYALNGGCEAWFDTPESTAISRMGYWPDGETLYVTFRNSGADYAYYGVSIEVWKEFCDAGSKGGYLNDHIKGYYEYERLW